MDLVLLDHLNPDGLKGAEPDVQRYFGSLNGAGTDAVEHFRSEVKPGGGCGDRSKGTCIDGLVLFAIGWRVGSIDVGRKRDVSDALDHGEEIRDAVEAEMALAKFPAGDDFCREFVGLLGGVETKVNALAQAQLASGMDESFPQVGLGGELAREQHFDFAMKELGDRGIGRGNGQRPRTAAVSVEPGRQHARVINHQ